MYCCMFSEIGFESALLQQWKNKMKHRIDDRIQNLKSRLYNFSKNNFYLKKYRNAQSLKPKKKSICCHTFR